MTFTAQQLCDQFPNLIIAARNAEQPFSSFDSVEDYGSESLVFVRKLTELDQCSAGLPAVLVTNEEVAATVSDAAQCVLVVADVRLSQALIRQFYDDYDSRDSEWPEVHPAAIIHPSAKLGDGVRVGPNTVIGEDVVVGNDTHIRANCVIEHGTQIGRDCVINSLVNIGYASRIGNAVVVHSGAVIANEGFGFAQDADHRYQRIPHTGWVEIQDDVRIGVNCNIDRGTYGKTLIERGVKLDALCHIAHNVVVGEDSIFVAQTGVAGSSNIGKRVIASGQTGILDHRTIVDDAVLVHRCGVTEDISKPGMWAGTPPRPFKEYVRNLNSNKRLVKLEQSLADLRASIEKRQVKS